MSDVTGILSQIDAGDSKAAEQLLPRVYGELRKLAAMKLADEKPRKGWTAMTPASQYRMTDDQVDAAGVSQSLLPRPEGPSMRSLLLALVTLATLSCFTTCAADEPAFYDPAEKQIEGWTIKVDPQLLTKENEEVASTAFTALANHLQRVKYIVPKDRCEQLQKLPIWLELQGALGGMQYHPDRGWLLANKHDPRLVKHVHIPQAKELYDPQMWAKHPYVVLHELAHAYHDQVLSFENAEVIATYDNAKEKKLYDEVLLYTGKKVRHYGLTDHKEYFAESTEAYFGVNDFYPFVRAELKEHDPTMFKLLEKIWGRVR